MLIKRTLKLAVLECYACKRSHHLALTAGFSTLRDNQIELKLSNFNFETRSVTHLETRGPWRRLTPAELFELTF